MNNRYIISLGGSLIVPDEIDIKFLKALRGLLATEARRGKRFFIAPGGGRTARKYSAAAETLGVKQTDDLDWLGIYAIRLNRLLLGFVFKKIKGIEIINAHEARPGESSDAHAVRFARQSKARVIINLSNIDYVYDKNPKKHPDAKPLKQISWLEFRKIVGNKWRPNQSWPFDPIASKHAEQLKLHVVFLNGKNLANLKNFLSGKRFKGTIIG